MFPIYIYIFTDFPLSFRDFDQGMGFEGRRFLMRYSMSSTVGHQTLETLRNSFQFSAGADITRHMSRCGIRVSRGLRLELHLPQFQQHLRQDGVPTQHRSLSEGVLTQRTSAHSPLVWMIPVTLDAIHAEAVSARDGHWILQYVQTYRTVELVLGDRNTGLCHFVGHTRCSTQTQAQKSFVSLEWGVCRADDIHFLVFVNLVNARKYLQM